MRPRRRVLVGFAPLLLAACLSQGPPAPPVRWFDPTPELPAAAARTANDAPAVAPVVIATAGPLVRQEFVLRTAARELAIDDLHRWSAPPDRIVEVAVERALAAAGDVRVATLRLVVGRFEIDLLGAPRAVVELDAATGHGPVVVRGEAGAEGREPGQLAAAMAVAIATAVERLVAALR